MHIDTKDLFKLVFKFDKTETEKERIVTMVSMVDWIDVFEKVSNNPKYAKETIEELREVRAVFRKDLGKKEKQKDI